MSNKTTTHLQITGKRWRQKTHGNTYFSAVGYINGKEVARIDFQYGYGDHYTHEILKKMIKHSDLPEKIKDNESPWRYAERIGATLDYSATDVPRKKDL